MAIQRQIRRGTKAENDAFTGAQGETVFDTDNNRLINHDGSTSGGIPVPNYLDDQSNKFTYSDAIQDSAGDYVVTLYYAPDSYIEGQNFLIVPDADNVGACDVDVNGLGLKSILKHDNSGSLIELDDGDLRSGIPSQIFYDGTQFILFQSGGGGVLASASVTNNATLDIAVPSGYDSVKIRGNVVPLTNLQDLRVQISDDSGASFESSSYTYISSAINTSGSQDNYFSTSDNRINISPNTAGFKCGNASGESMQFEILMTDYGNGGKFTLLSGTGTLTDGSGNAVVFKFSGHRKVASVVTNLRFLFGSGNITGTVTIVS